MIYAVTHRTTVKYATAVKLVDLFVENFAQFADHVDAGVREAAPRVAA